jgi:UDP-N-acetylmuramate dehydrogenase
MRIIKDKTFKDLTTFRTGGKIKYFVEVKNEDEIRGAVRYAKKNNLAIFILGDGSDLLVSDKPFGGLVIKFVGSKYSFDGDFVTGEGGMVWDDLVKICVDKNLRGIECLSGIPGTVGAAPVQNIGAYGQELAETFYNLKAFDTQNEKFVFFSKDECRFGYRESVFRKKGNWQRYLIVEVTLKLNRGKKSAIVYETLKNEVSEDSSVAEVRDAVLRVRRQRLEDPAEFGNAGSFFKNPVIGVAEKEKLKKEFPDLKVFPSGDMYKIPAAWLIDKAGWKGRGFGEAAVSQKHALILINKTGKAPADDVYKLSEKISADIFKKFKIRLETEVQFINFK